MNRVIALSGLFLLSLLPQRLLAQVNPQQGYIITNENDTVRGTIDYLTDASNAKTCSFRKEGETAFQTYHPTDIRGYRLNGDGVYYVSRLFTGEEKPEMLFAEFLLQGGVSLFRYYHDGYNYFGFMDTDGKEAIIRDDKLNDDLSAYDKKLQARREKVQQVGTIMRKDPAIAGQLWKMDLESNTLTKLVQEYDETYCTSDGDCVVFRYDTKKTAAVARRYFVGAGINYSSFKPNGSGLFDEDLSGNTYSGVAPTVFVGMDMIFPRFSQNLISQAMLSFTPYSIKASKTGYEGGNPKLTSTEIALRLGVAYMFSPEAKVKPYLKGGLTLAYHLSLSEKDIAVERQGQSVEKYTLVGDIDYSRGTRAGLYLGAGLDISHIRLSATYDFLFWIDGTKCDNTGLLLATAAYLF